MSKARDKVLMNRYFYLLDFELNMRFILDYCEFLREIK